MRMFARSALVLVGLAATVGAQSTVKQLPPPFQTPSAENRPVVIPQPNGTVLKAPSGFTVGVAAEGFDTPRFMILGPNNDVLLSDSARTTLNGGSVYVLTDANHDGKFDEKIRILQGLDRPYGLALWKDYLYVAETTSLKRYKYDAKTRKATPPGEEIVSMKNFDMGHWTRNILFDPKGEKLYLTIGSRSNVEAGEDPMRAAVHRFNPDGTGHETYVSGTRNPVGLRWYPGTDTLWITVEERDLLGDDLAPDYLTALRPGAFYGWPYAYIGANEDPRRQGEAPELVKTTRVPDVLLGAHVSALDVLFYTGKMFPAEYQGGAFITRHGSWNRSKRHGYDLAFLPFKNGRPAGDQRQFVSGFMLSPDSKEVWGRPVAMVQLADGSLLFSDDGGKKIWRVAYGTSSRS